MFDAEPTLPTPSNKIEFLGIQMGDEHISTDRLQEIILEPKPNRLTFLEGQHLDDCEECMKMLIHLLDSRLKAIERDLKALAENAPS